MKNFIISILLMSIVVSCKNSKNNIAKLENNSIQFTKDKDYLSPDPYTEFTEEFTMNRDSFLGLQFTLEKPLVKILKDIDSNMSEEELLKNGNFQFTILVNDKEVFKENLNKGAGTYETKTKQLLYKLPLISIEQQDSWMWFLWARYYYMSGGRDLLVDQHKITIEVRTYLKSDAIQTGSLLAKGSFNYSVAEAPFKAHEVPVQPIQPNSGWILSNDYYDTAKIEALNKKISQKRFENIDGIVVIKEGKLLIEEYFNGEGRDTLHNPRSVGKTIASTVMGIAIEEKYIKDENQQLKDFYDLKKFKNYSPEKEEITLKALLTMSSGMIGDDSDMSNPGNEEYMYPTDDWVKFALDLPIDKNKKMNKDYTYFTAGVVVLGDIIHKSVPGGLESYADKKLFAPLGITNYRWQYTPQGVGNTAGGIQLRALDFAKYGQLYKNKGKWNGKQILPEAWVEKSLAKQVSQAYAGIENGYYGYLFWNKVYRVNGKDYEVSFCTGNGGNKIFVFKDIPFVVVITSSNYGRPYAHTDADKMMTEYILPAVFAKK
ncbi:serine hydrolase [Pontimicrobium sp. SW4]|uniref:Serine hydrolase n=1 Tax=Pontimicrobium sp. SW4 TaxID=3153519 RepID=A0AAU7BWK6_9FLAO